VRQAPTLVRKHRSLQDDDLAGYPLEIAAITANLRFWGTARRVTRGRRPAAHLRGLLCAAAGRAAWKPPVELRSHDTAPRLRLAGVWEEASPII